MNDPSSLRQKEREKHIRQRQPSVPDRTARDQPRAPPLVRSLPTGRYITRTLHPPRPLSASSAPPRRLSQVRCASTVNPSPRQGSRRIDRDDRRRSPARELQHNLKCSQNNGGALGFNFWHGEG
ncbi:hypothetical protein ZWY2020_045172 [Hordeum vulgare]|nr:hypothetical protein ZWY2020_045172 [Hordeum vulgare]